MHAKFDEDVNDKPTYVLGTKCCLQLTVTDMATERNLMVR
jgi:hypothetical protein